MVNEQYFEQNLNDFLELFSKKVQTSYSGRLRAPAVHGVSSKKETADFEKCIVHGEYGIPISGIWSRIAAVFDLLLVGRVARTLTAGGVCSFCRPEHL